MTDTETFHPVFHRLDDLHRLCPDLRLGQLMAILGELAADETGRGLWDVEDHEFGAAITHFERDLRRRTEPASD